ncbi:MAG: putative sulfate exporter family transporter, partial [Candidatus Bathyarchaeota archaeon]
ALNMGNVYLLALLGLGILALTTLGVYFKGDNVTGYWMGFPVVFIMAVIAFIISKQATIKYYGLAYVLWALLLGLVISNIMGTPEWLKSAIKTELFIKIGLVLLGAEILFSTIVKGGLVSVAQSIGAVLVTWYICYYLATRAGLNQSFASIMASAVSICGVSAAIAAGGAIKGDKKEISFTISMVLLTSIIMLVAEPFIARMLGLPSAVAGAWIGGTIDTTGAVVAAGALYDETAMTAAAIVKLAQNVLIGVAAFGLAIYWTLKVESEPDEKPSLLDIWYRFPKFIVGFLTASLVFSFILMPAIGEPAVRSILSLTKGFRGWFFCLSFVCIGLETRFSDLMKVGGTKAASVYIIAQLLNVVLVYFLAWLLFGGIFFPPPI